jgi:iron complex outermembrane receptor protein
MSTGFSFLKSVSDEPVPSFYILSHAKTLIQSNLVYTTKHFTLAINGIYKKRNAQTAPAIDATITPDYFC